MSGKIISLINFKGGVGKTTLAVNLAASIAKNHKKKTLLIDLDPQSNSSIWLMRFAAWQEISKRENIHKTASHLFVESFNLNTAIRPYPDSKQANIPNLYLLPATYHMVSLERAISQWCDRQKIGSKYSPGQEYTRLLDDKPLLKQGFDYIFIDCPPNLYLATGNAVVNSDYLLVPVIPDTLSTIGLKLLVNELAKMIQPFTNKADWRLPKLLGVVLSKVRTNVAAHQAAVSTVEGTIEYLKTKQENGLGLLCDGTKVYTEQRVRELIAHSEAMHEHLPICLYNEKSAASADIDALATAILKDMEREDV